MSQVAQGVGFVGQGRPGLEFSRAVPIDDPRQGDGILHGQVPIEQADHGLQRVADDARTPCRAERGHELVVLVEDQRGRHRRTRPLARLDPVGDQLSARLGLGRKIAQEVADQVLVGEPDDVVEVIAGIGGEGTSMRAAEDGDYVLLAVDIGDAVGEICGLSEGVDEYDVDVLRKLAAQVFESGIGDELDLMAHAGLEDGDVIVAQGEIILVACIVGMLTCQRLPKFPAALLRSQGLGRVPGLGKQDADAIVVEGEVPPEVDVAGMVSHQSLAHIHRLLKNPQCVVETAEVFQHEAALVEAVRPVALDPSEATDCTSMAVITGTICNGMVPSGGTTLVLPTSE